MNVRVRTQRAIGVCVCVCCCRSVTDSRHAIKSKTSKTHTQMEQRDIFDSPSPSTHRIPTSNSGDRMEHKQKITQKLNNPQHKLLYFYFMYRNSATSEMARERATVRVWVCELLLLCNTEKYCKVSSSRCNARHDLYLFLSTRTEKKSGYFFFLILIRNWSITLNMFCQLFLGILFFRVFGKHLALFSNSAP